METGKGRKSGNNRKSINNKSKDFKKDARKSHLGKSLTNVSQFFFQEHLKSINLLLRSVMFVKFTYKCMFQLKVFLTLGLILFLFWPYGKVSGFLIFFSFACVLHT